ncbi:hypothetical protein [Deinococcus ficus]|uniref:hypothetical protein n=1 Tax=Deinococcus ficus TaxID=317577 RepID=UPI0003B5EBC5|nr:hypothetical protein [Deinococcus ficus]
MTPRARSFLLPLALAALHAPAQAVPVLEGRTLRYESGPRLAWQRTYPDAAGTLTGPLEVSGTTYLGVGPAVYAYTAAGEVVGRADLTGTVTSLEAVGSAVRVGVQGSGYAELFTLERQGDSLTVQERVVPPPDPAVTGWLARVADAVPAADLNRAAQEDPTNPFLALRQAARTPDSDPYARLSALRRALDTTLPFPAWGQLAARLDAAGFPSAADVALDRARKDAAARGFDPELPVNRAALGAYGNPSAYAGTLLTQNKLGRAEVWMRHLRTLHPRFEGAPALYARYAELLDAQGRAGEAEDWRQFTRDLRRGTLYNLGLEGTRDVRDVVRLAALALVIALAGGLVTLAARAWRQQGLDTRPMGGRYRAWLTRPLSRARRGLLGYASLPQRFALALLAAALFVVLIGWQWSNDAGAGLRSAALSTGTYGGGWVSAQLGALDLQPGADTFLLTGLAAQLDGDDGAARERYTRALPDACARNNLGVIAQTRGDEPQARELYRAALAAQPGLAAAAYNLGLNPRTPETTFQAGYRPGEPRLCYPDQRSLTRAVTGDLGTLLERFLRAPLSVLTTPAGEPRPLGWLILLTALLGLSLFLSLLLPRAATDADLGRPGAYRVLSWLIPGSAFLDGAWGLVLLIAWATVIAALLPLSSLLRFPTLPDPAGPAVSGALLTLLAGLYLLNAAVLVTAEVQRRRRAHREGGA